MCIGLRTLRNEGVSCFDKSGRQGGTDFIANAKKNSENEVFQDSYNGFEEVFSDSSETMKNENIEEVEIDNAEETDIMEEFCGGTDFTVKATKNVSIFGDWIVLFEKDNKQYACAIDKVCTFFTICDIAVWENLEEEEREKFYGRVHVKNEFCGIGGTICK